MKQQGSMRLKQQGTCIVDYRLGIPPYCLSHFAELRLCKPHGKETVRRKSQEILPRHARQGARRLVAGPSSSPPRPDDSYRR